MLPKSLKDLNVLWSKTMNIKNLTSHRTTYIINQRKEIYIDSKWKCLFVTPGIGKKQHMASSRVNLLIKHSC